MQDKSCTSVTSEVNLSESDAIKLVQMMGMPHCKSLQMLHLYLT